MIEHQTLDAFVKVAAVQSAIDNDATYAAMKVIQTVDIEMVEDSGELVSKLTKKALEDDSKRASLWIGSLPPGKSRDAAISFLLDYLLRHGDHDSYHNWAELMNK